MNEWTHIILLCHIKKTPTCSILSEADYLQFPVVTFHLWFYWNVWTPGCLKHLWCAHAHVFDMTRRRRAGHDGAAGLWEMPCKYGSVLWRQHFIGLTCCTGAWSGLETQMWPFRASGYFMFKYQKVVQRRAIYEETAAFANPMIHL